MIIEAVHGISLSIYPKAFHLGCLDTISIVTLALMVDNSLYGICATVAFNLAHDRSVSKLLNLLQIAPVANCLVKELVQVQPSLLGLV